MKFFSTQQNLTWGLSIAEKVLSRNFSLPILQDVLITAEKNKGFVKISSTDLEIGIEVVIPAKVEEEGTMAAPNKLLNEFIKNLPNENVEISEKNKKISILCKNYKVNIKGDDSAEFPFIPIKQNEEGGLEMKKETFLKGISCVVGSVSTLDVKPEISGVFVCFRKKNIYFVATDSFRLSEKVVSTEKTYENKVIIPKKTSDAITRIFQDAGDLINIQIGNSQIIVKNDKITFISRVIEGDYPSYEQIIPSKFTTEITILKEEFVRHVKTAGLFSNKINEITIEANLKKQNIEILSQDQERGDHYSSVPCEVGGVGVRAIFNYQYLLEGVQNISSQNIKIKLNEPTTPVLITAEENDGFRYVVMPIKN